MYNKFLIIVIFLIFGGEILLSQTSKINYSKIGISSYYSERFQNKKTASGERFDMYDFTAAHPSLAFGTILKVTNLTNNRFTIVRVNDRGPFIRGRMIDISYAAALKLDMIRTGTARVKIEVITADEGDQAEAGKDLASNLKYDN
jgi:rare lipoprotein A